MLSTKYSVSALLAAVQNRHLARLLELGGFGPFGALLLHLAVRIAAALQRLQRLLQRLRHVAVVNHAATQIDDLVDVLDQQRAFFFARAAGRAGPDFILGINAADQRRPVACAPEHRIVLEAVVSRLGGEEAWRQWPSHGVRRTLSLSSGRSRRRSRSRACASR